VEEAARLREPEVRQQLRQCFARAENA
jgi:hypothetical protein